MRKSVHYFQMMARIARLATQAHLRDFIYPRVQKKKGRAAPKKSISIIKLRELKIPTRERQNENTLLRTDRQTDGRMTTQTGARLANFNVSFCLFELVKIAICMQPSLLLFSAESLCSDNQRLFEVSRRFDRE